MAADPKRCFALHRFWFRPVVSRQSGDKRLAHLIILFNGPSMCP
jgi:hypothetical protein